MGDPGVPVMIGLLAVPVGVLMLVVVLALIGGRWTLPGSYAAEPEPLEDYDEPFVDPWRADPWRLAEPPRPAPPPAPRHALPPVSRLALPAASQPPPPPRSPQRPSQDLVPVPRPYRPPAGPPPARPAYGSLAREQRDPYGHPAEPEQEQSSQQGFPYGPYRHQ